jgi:hypothetical protein
LLVPFERVFRCPGCRSNSIAADNVAVLRLLRNLSVDYVLVGFEGGIVEYEIMLPPPGDDAA